MMASDDHVHPASPGADRPAERVCPPAVLLAAESAHRALQALVDAAAAETAGRAGDPVALAGLGLQWRPGAAPADLAEQALRGVAEFLSDVRAVSGGRAHCYACGSSACEHAVAPTAGEVFTGYESTGRPCWQEFFSFLLALGDDRADRLFADPPEILARVVGRTRLIADQLRTFGRNSFTYRVWGQVVAGYLPVRNQRAAISVQVVEDKHHQLHLQVIADPLLREALADAPEDRRSAFARVHDAIAEARRQTLSLSTLWQHGDRKEQEEAVREKAFAILRHLAHSIEQKGRQLRRRTSHAEIRGGQNRPVHKAYDDVVAATAQDVYLDRFKQSLIVVGRSGRIHAFSREGRHITSLILAGDELERRVARGRYVPQSDGDMEAFRASVLAALPAATATPTEGPDA